LTTESTSTSTSTSTVTSTSTSTSKLTPVAAAVSTLAPPPVSVHVAAGKTEHMATVIDQKVLAVFQRKKDDESKSEYLSTLKPDSKILIECTIAGGKET